MNAIRAIETRYKGYRFRSRLEARWAVFFDALNLRWEYEPEGFTTSAGPYLPDFRVWTPQGQPIWYEVKPEHVEQDAKFSAFVLDLTLREEVRTDLLRGDPWHMISELKATVCPRCGRVHLSDVKYAKVGDGEFSLDCFYCDWETPCGGGHDVEFGVWDYYPHKGHIHFWAPFFALVSHAAGQARAARFEHGERG